MSLVRIGLLVTLLALICPPSWAAVTEEIGRFVLDGDLETARQAISQALESDLDDEERAQALRWLGRLEVTEENYLAALEAFRGLADEFGRTVAGREARTELALLEELARVDALTRVEMSDSPEEAVAGPEPGESVSTPTATAPPRPSEAPAKASGESNAQAEPTNAPEVVPQSAASVSVLVGSVGKPFDLAEKAGLQVFDYLEQNNVAAIFQPTASEALRGSDAVVVYLLSRARESGAEGLIVVRSRWGFREFVTVESFSAEGSSLWREKITGGTAHRSEEVTDSLMQKLWRKLDKRLGGPGLPVGD